MQYYHEQYQKNITAAAEYDTRWDKLQNKTILLAGASGMIGSFLADVIMYRNRTFGDNITLAAVARNRSRAQQRFSAYRNHKNFRLVIQDITSPLVFPNEIDYIINCASNTHPLDYANQPISTITTNIIGTHRLLELAAEKQIERYLYLSSVEIYGENKGDLPYFTEDACGYLDCNTLRAGYPEAKRCGEALCQAYRKEKNVDCAIVRLPRVYGETMLPEDSKAFSQFIKKGLAKEDIVLKSDGRQLFSYIYTPDAVTAMLTILLEGASGEAYNVSDTASDTTLRDLAGLIAQYAGTSVIFAGADEAERLGYSTATRALLDSTKLRALGWAPRFNLASGIQAMLSILSAQKEGSM